MNDALEVKSFNNFFMNSHNEGVGVIEFARPYEDLNSSYKKVVTNFTLNAFQKNELRKFLYKVENIAPSQSSFQIFLLKDELGFIADIIIDSLYTNFKIYLVADEFDDLIRDARHEIESQINTWKSMRFLGRYA